MKTVFALCFVLVFQSFYCLSQDILWEKEISIQHPFQFSRIKEIKSLNDNSLFCLISCMDSIAAHESPYMIKLSKKGDILWDFRRVFTKSVSPDFAIEQDNGDIHIYCTWMKNFSPEGNSDYRPMIIKLKSNGEFIESVCDSNLAPEYWYDNSIYTLNEDSSFVDLSSIYYRQKQYIYLTKWDKNTRFVSRHTVDSTAFSTENGKRYIIKYLERSDSNELVLFVKCYYNLDNSILFSYFLTCDTNFNIKIFKEYPYRDSLRYNPLLIRRNKNKSSYTVIIKCTPTELTKDSSNAGFIIRTLDNEGNIISEKINKNKSRFNIYDLDMDDQNNILIVGDSIKGGNYGYLAKTDTGKLIRWSYTTQQKNRTYSKILYDNERIYVVGSQRDSTFLSYNIYLACISNPILSIENNEENSAIFSISPNPASGFIEITYSNGALSFLRMQESVKIFNIFGEEVSTTPPFGHPFELKGESYKIDVSAFPPGVYFVRIGDKVGKFVKIQN